LKQMKIPPRGKTTPPIIRKTPQPADIPGPGVATSLQISPPTKTVTDAGARPGGGFGDLGRGAPARFDGLVAAGGGTGVNPLSAVGDITAGIGADLAGKSVDTAILQGAKRSRKTSRAGSL
jgi:hypothetical protein